MKDEIIKAKEEGVMIPIERETREFRNEFQIGELLKTAGQLEISEREKEILFSPIDPAIIEIRPDGLIYAPWTEYSRRLTEAFGLSWTLIPQGMPKIHMNHLIWGFWLIVRGKLMGFAIGEQEYFPQNPRMTWSDASEGAKSNALMRLCKELGIGRELWTLSFINKWKEEHAEYIECWNGREKKYIWVKRGQEPPFPWKRIKKTGASEGGAAQEKKMTEKQKEIIEKCLKSSYMTEMEKAKIKGMLGSLTGTQAGTIIDWWIGEGGERQKREKQRSGWKFYDGSEIKPIEVGVEEEKMTEKQSEVINRFLESRYITDEEKEELSRIKNTLTKEKARQIISEYLQKERERRNEQTAGQEKETNEKAEAKTNKEIDEFSELQKEVAHILRTSFGFENPDHLTNLLYKKPLRELTKEELIELREKSKRAE